MMINAINNLVICFQMIWKRIMKMPFVCIAMLMVLMNVSSAEAQSSRYWVGDPGENHNNTAYWSASGGNACGVGGGASIPTGTDIIYFSSSCNNSVEFVSDVTMDGMRMEAGYTGTVMQNDGVTLTIGSYGWLQTSGTFVGGAAGANLDVNGTFTLNGGTFNQGEGSNVNVSGSFTIGTGAVYNKPSSSGTLILDGDLSFADNTVSLQDLGRLQIGASPDTTTLTTDLVATSLLIDTGDALITDGYNVTISGTIDINGTLDAAWGTGGNTTVSVGGLWDATGGMFTNTNSTVLFTGTSASQTFDVISDGKAFNNVKFDDNGGGTTWELEDTLNINGTFELADGIVDTNVAEDNSVTSTGTFRISGGTFEARGSTITLSNDFLSPVGSAFSYGTSIIDMLGSGDIEVATSGVYGINVAAPGQTNEIINTELYTHGIITIGSGTLDGERVRFERDSGVPMILNPAATLSNSGFVYQDGTDTVVGADYQGPVYFRVSAETYMLNGNVSATSMLIADLSSSGTATVDTTSNNYSITLSNDLDIGDGSGARIGRLLLNDSTLTVADDLRFRSAGGGLNTLIADQAQIYVGGDWNASFGANMMLGTSTVTFNGTSGTSIVTTAATGTIGQFANVEINDDDGGSNLIVQVSEDIIITGSLKIQDGSLDLDGYKLNVSGNVDINDELDASNGTGGNSNIYVNGSWDATGGTFTNTNSTVVFTGTGSQNITSAASSFNNLTLNDGLVGYWKFDETSGAVATDSSGNANDGNYISTPTPSLDVSGSIQYNNLRSLDFNGSDYILVDGIEVPTNDFTYSIWAVRDSTVVQHIYFMNSNTSGQNELVIFVLPTGQIRVITNSVIRLTTTSTVVSDGSAWHHVAVTRSGSTIRVYINGVLDPITGTDGGAFDFTNCGMLIGADSDSGCNTTVNDFWDGHLDEARVYNRALSTTEIQRLANGYMPATSSGTYTLQDNLDVNGTLTLNDGTLNTGADRQINVGSSWMNNGGVFVENSGQVVFDGTGTNNLILAGSHTFNSVDITGVGTWELQDSNGVATWDVSAGTLTYAASTIIEPIIMTGDMTLTGGTYSGQATNYRQLGDLTLSSGSLTAPSRDLMIDGNFTYSAGTYTHSTGTVVFTGTSGTSQVSASGMTFNNVVIDDIDDGADVVVLLSTAIDVDGSLRILDGTLDVNASNQSINLGGNWQRDVTNGTFVQRSGNVILDGVNQSFIGSTTFYDFSKTEDDNSTDSILTFEAGSTFTVQGSLTLDGFDGDDRINLVSSLPGTRFNLNVTGTPMVDYIDLTDSEALGTDIIAVNSIPTSNNDNGEGSPEWVFGELRDVSGSTDLGDGQTIRIAIDGVLSSETASTLAGAWTISNAIVITDRPLVVWADAVADANETSAVTIYDGLGNITGMVLTTGSLSIGSDDNVTIDMTDLALYDNDNDEDIMFTANSGTLDVQGGNVYTDETLNILTNNTLLLDTGWDLVTEELIIAGTLTISGTNDIQLNDGGWSNNGTFMGAASTVSITSNAAVSVSGTTTFYGLELTSTGCSSITLGDDMIVQNDINISIGGVGCGDVVLANGSAAYSINLYGDALVADGGVGAGGGVEDDLTLVMSGTMAQSVSNTNSGYFGGLTISNSSSTVSLATDLSIHGSLTIDVGGTLDVTSNNYALTQSGGPIGWTNNGVFVARSSTVEFSPGASGDITIFGTNTFYNFYANSAQVGDVDVSDNILVQNDLTINLTNASSGLRSDGSDMNSVFVNGDVWNSSVADMEDDLTIVLQGTGTQTISQTNTGDFGDILISNTFNEIQLLSNLSVNDDITVNANTTFDLNGFDVTGQGATTFSVSGTIELDGDQTFVSADPTFTAGAWVEYTATGGSLAIQDWTYENVQINGSGATFHMQTNEILGGEFMLLTGTFSTQDIGVPIDYNLTTTGSFRILGGHFTANASTVTMNGNMIINNTAGLFNSGTSTVVLGTSSNVSNANSDNKFFNLLQRDGITNTLTGNLAIGSTGVFTTGDATSTIQTDGSGRGIQFYDTSTITNNGANFNANGFTGDLRVDFYGGSRTTGAGNYGDTQWRILIDNGATFTQDGFMDVGNFSIGALVDGDSNTFDTNGFDFVARDFVVGTSGETARYSTFNAQSSSVTIDRDMTLRASDVSGDNIFNGQTAYIDVGDDWSNSGVFNEGTSTVEFTGNNISVVGSTTFHNFVVVETANDFTDPQLTFTAGATYVIQGTLQMAGLDVNDRVTVRSSIPGTRWNINITSGQGNVDFVDVSDSEVIGSNDIQGTNSLDTSNNDSGEGSPNWIFTLTGTIDISGTSNLPPGTTVRVSATGSFQNLPASTTAGDGSWTISGVPGLTTDEIIHVWAEGVAEAVEATAVTLYDGTGNITGMVLNSNILMIGSDDNSTIRVTDLAEFDNDDDEDVIFVQNIGTLQMDPGDVYTDERIQIIANNTLQLTNGQNMYIRDITIDGDFDINGTAGVIITDGDWVNNGTFDPATSSVLFQSTSGAGSTISGDTTFYNLTTFGAGTTTISSGNIVVDEVLYVTAGTLDFNDNTIDINGSMNILAGQIHTGTGAITIGDAGDDFVIIYDGTLKIESDDPDGADITLNAGTWLNVGGAIEYVADSSTTLFSSLSSYYDLVINSSGNTFTANTDMTVSNDLKIQQGTYDLDGYELTVGGSVDIDGTLDASTGTDADVTIAVGAVWDSTGGTFTNTNSMVSFTGTTATQSFAITSGGQSFNDVEFDDSSGGTTWLLEDALDIDGNISLTSGILDVNVSENNSINFAGNWTVVSGIFAPQNGTVVFDRAAGTSTMTSNGQNFYNLQLNDGGGTGQLQQTDTLRLTGSLSVDNGTLDLVGQDMFVDGNIDINDTLDASTDSGGNSTIYGGGDWDMTSGTFTSTDSTVVMTGTTTGYTITSDSKSFNNFTLNDGLVGYWKFDETSSPAIDSSGYGNHATWNSGAGPNTNTPNLIKYDNPRSMNFDGDNDYLDLGTIDVNHPLMLANTDFTISVWVYQHAGGDDFQRVVDKSTNQNAADGYALWLRESITTIVMRTDGAAYTSSSEIYSLNSWTHIAAVVTSTDFAIYVNGVEDTGASFTTGSAALAPNVVTNMRIGTWNHSTGREYDGEIEELRIYKRALTPAEITRLANGYMPSSDTNLYTLQDALDVQGTLRLNSGHLNTGSNQSVNVGGDWINNGGVYTPNASTTILDGTASYLEILSGSQTFYDLQLEAAGTWTMQDDLPVSNLFQVRGNGTLTYSTDTNIEPLSIIGNILLPGGGPTGTFLGNANQFHHQGNVEISAGTYTAPTDLLEITGSFTHSGGTFNNSSSTVIFGGTVGGEIDTSAGTTFNNVIIGDGLVGYWKLDETASPSLDHSGFGNHCSWSNSPTSSSDVPEVDYVNPASLEFDRSDIDFLECGSDESLDLTEAITIMAWVNPVTVDGESMIVSRTNNSSTNWRFMAQAFGGGTEWAFRVNPNVTHSRSGTTLSSGTWYHLAATYDRNNVRLYTNGAADGVSAQTAALDTSYPIKIARGIGGAQRHFDGLIDEVRIYNRVLSAAEIAQIAAGTIPQSLGNSYTLQTTLDVDNNLYLNADELNTGSNQSISVAGDWVNNGGKFTANSGSVLFDGSTAGNIIVTRSQTFYGADVSGLGEWSLQDNVFVSSSFNVSTGSLTYATAENLEPITVNGSLRINGGIFNGTSNRFRNVGDLTIGSGTFNAPTDVLEIIGTFSHSGGTFNTNSSTVMFIGTTNNYINMPSGDAFNDVSINDGLIGYWKLDESSSPARDSSGYLNNGTWMDDTTSSNSTSGEIQFYNPRSASFDGTNDYIQIASTYEYPSQAFTITSWVLPNTTSNDAIFDQGGSAPNRLMRMEIDSSTAPELLIGASSGDWGLVWRPTLLGGATFSTTKFQHLTFTWDGATARFYYNGVEQASTGYAGTMKLGVQTAPVLGRELGGGNNFSGLIDEVRIYDRALSATEIQALANGRMPATAIGQTTLTTAVDINGDLVIGAGEFDVGANQAVNLAGSWNNYGGRFTPNTGTITFDGTSTGNTILSGSQTFYNADIAGSGEWSLSDNIASTSSVDVSAGTLTYVTDTNIEPITAFGTLSINGGTFSGTTTRFRNDGALSISSGTFDSPTDVLEIIGTFTHSGGTFNTNSSTVMFVGTGQNYIDQSGGTAFNDVAINDGLVGYWRLDESSSPVKDSSGYSNDGSWSGNTTSFATTTSSIQFSNPGAVSLDGTGDYINTAESRRLNPEDMTVAFWLYIPTGHGNVNFDRIFELGGFNNSGGISMEFNGTTGVTPYVWSGPATWGTLPSYTFSSDEWFHVVLTSQTAPSQQHRFYINGIQQGATNTDTRVVSVERLTIGARNTNNNQNQGEFIIDDFRIYNRILSQNQISSLVSSIGPVLAQSTTTLQTNLDVDGDILISSGTLDVGSNRLINVAGSWLNQGGVFNEGTSTVIFDAQSGTVNIQELQTFYHIQFNDSPGGTATFNQYSSLDIDGNLNITDGTLDASTSNHSIKLAGNWINNDTFTPRNGTVEFNGANQTVTGATSFYSIVKYDLVDDGVDSIIAFEAGTTLTLSGTITLQGLDDSDRVNIVSTIPGTRSTFDVAIGNQRGRWLDIQDSQTVTSDLLAVRSIENTNTDAPESSPHWIISLGEIYEWTGSSDATTWEDQANWSVRDSSDGDDGYPDDNLEEAFFLSGSNTIDTPAGILTIGGLQLSDAFTGTVVLSGTLIADDGAGLSGDIKVLTGTLSHLDNTTTETNKLVVLADGDLTVAAGAQINADELGYSQANGPGAGVGSLDGGSYGGLGGDNNSAESVLLTSIYGSITSPVNLGSGGAATLGGDGGGAIILTVAGTTTIDGTVSADGGVLAGNSSAGSGGTVSINTAALLGTGTLQANGASSGGVGAGGGGRIAIVQSSASNLSGFTGTLSTYGGDSGGTFEGGAAGTVYLESSGQLSGQGTLIIDNNNRETMGGVLTVMPTSVNVNNFASVVIRNNGNIGIGSDDTIDFTTVNIVGSGLEESFVTIVDDTGVTFPDPFVISNYMLNIDGVSAATGDWTIASGGALSHSQNADNETWTLDLTLTGNLDVQSGGKIITDGKGYLNEEGIGSPASNNGDGGGYGGRGGDSTGNGAEGLTYGSITAPVNIGSGAPFGGLGGGAVILNVSGATTVDGSISSDGFNSGGGSRVGSGGSVYLTTGSLVGSGDITANGVDTTGAVASSGGGRIAIVLSSSNTFSGFTGTITAYGGDSDQADGDGAAGTVYEQTASQGAGNGILTIRNFTGADTATGVYTALDDQDNNLTTVGSLVIEDSAQFLIGSDDELVVGGTLTTLTIDVTGSLTNAGTLQLGGTSSSIGGTLDLNDVGNTVRYIGQDDNATQSIPNVNHYNVILDNNGTSFSSLGDLDVDGSFTVENGSFVQNNFDLNVAGNFTIAATGGFVKPSTSGTFTLDGDLNYADYTSPLQNVGKLVIGQSPDTTILLTDMSATSLKIMATDFLITDGFNVYLTGTMDINGDLDATAGTGGNTDIHVGGPWDSTGGTFTSANTTVMFVGTTSALTITSAGESFENLVINSSIGLVGYWKLDESSSPSLDYSGYGHHGIWVNDVSQFTGTSTTINFNNLGSTEFDGAGDYISIGDEGLVDGIEEVTFSAWVYPRSATSGNIISAWGSSFEVNTEFEFTMRSGTQIEISISDSVANLTAGRYTTNNVVQLNQWTHVAVVWSGGTNFTIYHNGVAVTPLTINGNDNVQRISDTGAAAQIGMRADGNLDFDGYIDEVRVYARALSSTEILRMAEGRMPSSGVGTYTLQDNLDVDGTLSLNDGTLDTGSNRQINVGRSWLNHGGQFVPSSGVVIFDGGVAGNQIISGSNTFASVSVVGLNGGWELQDNTSASGSFTLALGDLSYATSTIIEPIVMDANLSINAPFGSFTGTSTRFRHQGNVSISNGTYTAPTDVVEIDGSFDHTGGTFTNSSSTVMFTGTTTSLTINTSGGGTYQDMILNDGLLAYWPLDESTSASLDYSGYDNHLDWVNAPTSTTATSSTIKFHNPSSLQFDGENNVLSVSDYNINKRLDIGAGEEFTISVWVRSSDTSQDQKVIDNRDGTEGGYQLRFTTGGGFFLRIDEGPGDVDTGATPTVMDGTWKHIAAGRSSTQHFLYVNAGTPDTSADATLSDLSNTIDFQLGGESSGSGAWNGEIDDVRIYNRALSFIEVQRLANGEQPSTGLGTYTLASNLDVDGTLRLNAGTFDVSASDYQVNVGGDWENFGGIFNARSATVVLDGSDQHIPASETFYTLSKNLTAGPARTLTFGQQSTVTIQNVFDIGGFDTSNRLNLRSSSVGTRFNVNVTGGMQNVSFVDVRDSEAISNNIRTTSSINSGNNDDAEAGPRWIFGPLRGAVMMVE